MNQENKNVKVGEIRPSQVLTTFGIGAIIDLPNISVMVMGLEDWQPFLQDSSEIKEERLLVSVRELLGQQVQTLRNAPIVPETDSFSPSPFDPASRVGIPVAPFPRWMVCPYCRRLAPLSSGLFKLEPHLYRPDLVRYCHANCNKPGKPPTALPARFIVACRNGHLDEFPWVKFVHGTDNPDCAWSLRLREFGASGEASSIEVRCDTCGAFRRMSDAFKRDDNGLGPCRGRLPHLVDFAEGGCKDIDGSDMRQVAMLQGASNSWFAVMLSALAIPQAVDELTQLIEDQWTTLQQVESQQNIQLLRSLPQSPLRDLAAFTDDQIWEAVQSKKTEGDDDDDDDDDIESDLKTPEWLVFSNPHSVERTRDFRLRVTNPPARYSEFFEKIVLAERLREVRGLVGFTRIESPGDYDDPSAFPASQRVPLSRKSPKWVPASEIRGEGIFFHFSEEKIQSWIARNAVKGHEGIFSEAHRRWRMARGLEPVQEHDPGIRFVLLHSFAHALIRQLAVECGYTAASLRERIYSRSPGEDGPTMAGVLIYTAAPDSEGTLGGLVSLGEPQTLERHLDQALDAMRLCASDPLCAEHHPYRDGTTLHGASCHACLFAPETSCERGNKYLDRTVLVPTVDQDRFAFFNVPGVTSEQSTESVDDDETDADASDGRNEQINLYDLVDHGVPDAHEVSIRLPNDMAKELGLSANGATFELLGEGSSSPNKNDIVIVIRDQMRRGDEKVRIACGKLWWQKQTQVESGDATIAVMIRSGGTPVRFTLKDSEWEKFRPVAILKQ